MECFCSFGAKRVCAIENVGENIDGGKRVDGGARETVCEKAQKCRGVVAESVLE